MKVEYKDWRDKINPDLLHRYWKKLGCPGTFLRHTSYGIQIIEWATPFGNVKTVINELFIFKWLECTAWKCWTLAPYMQSWMMKPSNEPLKSTGWKE